MAMDPCVKETLSSRTREYCRKDDHQCDPLIFPASVRQPTDKPFSECYRRSK
jgi:hypothetical protein